MPLHTMPLVCGRLVGQSTQGELFCSSKYSACPHCGLSPLQVVEVIDPRQRDSRLDELLHKYHSSRKNRVIIFVLYKKEAARVEALLQKKGWKVRSLCVKVSIQTQPLAASVHSPFSGHLQPQKVAPDLNATHPSVLLAAAALSNDCKRHWTRSISCWLPECTKYAAITYANYSPRGASRGSGFSL